MEAYRGGGEAELEKGGSQWEAWEPMGGRLPHQGTCGGEGAWQGAWEEGSQSGAQDHGPRIVPESAKLHFFLRTVFVTMPGGGAGNCCKEQANVWCTNSYASPSCHSSLSSISFNDGV